MDNSLFKSVNELSSDELAELELQYKCLKDIDLNENISMDEVKDYFASTSFVDEDFFCNIK